MDVQEAGIETQRQGEFRGGRGIFAILEVGSSEARMADRGVRLQLSYFAELLNGDTQPALPRGLFAGLCVLDNLWRQALQKNTAGKEGRSHALSAGNYIIWPEFPFWRPSSVSVRPSKVAPPCSLINLNMTRQPARLKRHSHSSVNSCLLADPRDSASCSWGYN